MPKNFSSPIGVTRLLLLAHDYYYYLIIIGCSRCCLIGNTGKYNLIKVVNSNSISSMYQQHTDFFNHRAKG